MPDPPPQQPAVLQLTAEQLQNIIAGSIAGALQQAQAQGHGLGGGTVGAAAAGSLPPCSLGRDKTKRYQQFREWLTQAEAKMEFLAITESKRKIAYLRSNAGPELTLFWEKEVRVRFTAVAADAAEGVPGQDAHSYEEIVEESKKELLAMVNRDRAVIDLLRMSQGDRLAMEFVAAAEDQARLCRADIVPIKEEDLTRMALIGGMKDRSLAEKALAENYNLKTTIDTMKTRESSKANAVAMRGLAQGTEDVKRVKGRAVNEYDTDEIEEMEADLKVMKLRRQGRYSSRRQGGESRKRCRNCNLVHAEGDECSAKGRTCYKCDGQDHFARAPACPGSKEKGKVRSSTKKVTERDTATDSDSSDTDQEVRRVESRVWPGTTKSAKPKLLRRVQAGKERKITRSDRWVTVYVGGRKLRLFADTGSKFSIISPHMYHPKMGEVVAANCVLRSWGSNSTLDVKGMVRTEIRTRKGARRTSWVYIVGGHKPEPLLGDRDAEALGIVTFNPEGREPEESELEEGQTVQKLKERSLPEKLRAAGFKVNTSKGRAEEIKQEDREEAMSIVKEYHNTVFLPGIGCIKTDPVKFQFEKNFKPIQPPRRGVPYHYQNRLSDHLEMMRKEGAMEDINPREAVDCTMNLVITEKKSAGQIRMNVDATPINQGIRMTKYHVPTAAEVRHDLENAAVFSELDMGYGFHQIPLHPESAKMAVFQSHEGLHRMKRLFFGPRPSTGIFHHEVTKCFRGVEGVTTIHDNILVYGRTAKEHNVNLRACLTRAEETGVRLKLGKSTFCSPEVKWFGRVFSNQGYSADPDKLAAIVEAGRPTSIEDMRSFLQACSYNAKFTFDHSQPQTYQEITAPLREMLEKGAKFKWTNIRERSYQSLLRILSDKTTLRPFRPNLPIHFISDACRLGISASVYQEEEGGDLVPVDHVDRALSVTEQGWGSQIEWESLGKSWGMQMLRPYLIGKHFTSWGDHYPLVPLYNNLSKPASRRVAKHRQQVQDLSFSDKYLSGKLNPCDYKSRHPTQLTGLSPEEREKLSIDDSEEVMVMRMLVEDMPQALTIDMLKDAVAKDQDYQLLLDKIRSGHKPDPSSTLQQYRQVWEELSILHGVVMRQDRIVIPHADLGNDVGNLRQWVVELAHEGHVGGPAAKRLLRQRIWFPGMDQMVETRTSTCAGCQPSTETHHRDPLKPTTAPKTPFRRVAADHWGPTPDGKHLLVVIDLLTRYPEVVEVKGTAAEANIRALDDVFSRHFPPELLLTDNGPPFNTGPDHPLQIYFKKMGITHRPTISAEDPEANGTCESFMKHLKKVWHTSITQHRDPFLDLNRHLRSFRSTPHPTTGAIPAELLFGRKVRTIFPDLRPDPAGDREDIVAARDKDRQSKVKMKQYKDNHRNVKPHTIAIGDRVLLKQKSTKKHPPHDPDPYSVVDVQGTQITAVRHGATKTRDSQRFKKVAPTQPPRFRNLPPILQLSQEQADDPDIGPPQPAVAAQQHPGPHAEVPDQHPHDVQHAAEHPPAPLGEEAERGVDRRETPAQERWSFSPPANWSPPGRKRPLTRGRTKQREEERARVREQGSRGRPRREK